MSWMPISKDALENEIASQCKDISDEELAYFNKIRVPLESVKIERWGNTESVFVVAKAGATIIFYEDIEEGFEITELNEQGAISDYGASQFTLQQVINQLRASNS
jgi:hypothetical protein